MGDARQDHVERQQPPSPLLTLLERVVRPAKAGTPNTLGATYKIDTGCAEVSREIFDRMPVPALSCAAEEPPLVRVVGCHSVPPEVNR